jgi:hypothetical protein
MVDTCNTVTGIRRPHGSQRPIIPFFTANTPVRCSIGDHLVAATGAGGSDVVAMTSDVSLSPGSRSVGATVAIDEKLRIDKILLSIPRIPEPTLTLQLIYAQQ